MSINDQWVRYLAAEGYVGNVNDMLQQALQSETGSSLKQINTLWYEYLRGKGYTGSLNDMMYAWLGDKGYTGNLNDRWMQALVNDDVFDGVVPPIGCSITLTGDIAAVFGAEPLDISGQTVSKTVPETPADTYAAGGPAVPVSWTGWRGFAYKASVYSSASGMSSHSVGLYGPSVPAGIQVFWNEFSSEWFINPNSLPDTIKSGTFDEKVGIRVDGATGDVEVYVGGVVKTKADYPSLGGVFSGADIEPVAMFGGTGAGNLTEGDTYAAQIFTAAADLTDVGFPAGTLDWCGNEIEVVDGPYAYRLNASAPFIAASAPGTEKMIPSADEQTGAATLTFTDSTSQKALAGNFETESPLVINYLNDISYGTGDFVCELHIDWPALTGSSLTGIMAAFLQLIDGASGEFIQPASIMTTAASSNIITVRIWDDVDEGVKKYSTWKDGAVQWDGLVIGVDLAVGIDLSQLFVTMYTQEAGTAGTEDEFADPSPQIITRFVTDPAEMVYAASVLPRPAKTVVGDGEVIPVPADPISILGDKLVAWYTSDPSTLFTTSTGETPVSAGGDPVGLRANRVSGGPDAIQATATARPLWQTGPDRIVYDGVDDKLDITLPAISGGQIVISSPVGIWIDSLDFAGGTFSLGHRTYTGGPAGLWSLLGNAEMQVCILDDAMTNEEQDKLVAYLVAQGSPGLITLGPEIVADPSFDDAGYWTTLGVATVSGGNLSFTNSTGGASDAAYRTNTTTGGKIYMATAVATSVDSGRAELSIGQGVGSVSHGNITTAGTFRVIGANGSSLNRAPRIANAILNGTPLTATFSSASLREVILP